MVLEREREIVVVTCERWVVGVVLKRGRGNKRNEVWGFIERE
jgi:hypothetical protein